MLPFVEYLRDLGVCVSTRNVHFRLFGVIPCIRPEFGFSSGECSNFPSPSIPGLSKARIEPIKYFLRADSVSSPVSSTIGGDTAFMPQASLGNIELGRTIDRYSVDIVLHGHAHLGNPIGRTPNGILVRNVAQSVTGGVVVHELERGVSPWAALGQPA